MKHISFLFVFLCVLFDSKAQKCTLVFRAQDEITVRIYKPIDDTYNFSYVSDKLDLKPNISIHYELEVNDFGCVMCRFPNGESPRFFLESGDQVEINYEFQKINISGSNAEGHNYYNYNYTKKGLLYYSTKMDPILRRYSSDTRIDYDSIFHYFQQELVLPYQADLKKMEMSGIITPKYSSILSRNLFFATSQVLKITYDRLLQGNIINGFKPSQEDIRNILSQLSQLYDTPYALSDASKKMPSNFVLPYYRIKYRFSDDETKEKFTKGYDKNFFGNYPELLMLSDSMQLRQWSTLFIQNLQEGTRYFNHDKVLAYLNEKFPDSEYVTIIKSMMAQKQLSEAGDEIVFLKESPSSIEELMQISGIRGKYAYIDLWETACIPCIFEFQYNDDVHKLFAAYNNLVFVYISIDKDRELWESRVNKYELKGYNIIASESLQKDIGMKVYKGTKVGSIPRYLLLDPEGNIINDNLPRPSRSVQLKPILADVFK